MSLPKQKANESDADYATRLEAAKEARRERNRKYRQANKEAARERNRKYYEANKEAAKERNRKYRQANKEAIRERHRKYRQANKEAARERHRKYYEANREVEKERKLKRYKAKVLANAKGKPLKNDFSKAARPKMLTELLLQEAENFCLEYGFDVEQKFDNDVLRQAARAIRTNPFYPVVVPEEEVIAYYNEHGGITNPWYCTDYLHESTITSKNWGSNLRRVWQNRA